jgi:Chlamydia polymorphic membrane protein (Chlamydia_PMP) repeat
MQGLISFRAVRRRIWLPTAVVLGCLSLGVAPAAATTFTVQNTDNSGPGSLSAVVAAANTDPSPPTVVDFAPSVTGIIYPSGTLAITSSMAIEGPGDGNLTIDGENAIQILTVSSSSTVSISGLAFASGVATSKGGAIYSAGTLNITDSLFTHNRAGGPAQGVAGNGGAINNTGTLTVGNSTFIDNSVDGATDADQSFGGAIYNGGTLNVTGSTFTGNTAGTPDGSGTGGAIYNAITLNVTNSTFTANEAAGPNAAGGAIFDDYGSGTLAADTIDANQVTPGSEGGAGIFEGNGSLVVTNTIVSGNSGGGNCGGRQMGGHNNLEGPAGDTSCGFALASADPKLGALADNGGPTQTQALEPGSPAIGAGTQGDCPTADQRSAARPQNGCDLGAYEVAPPVVGAETASSGGTTAETLSATASNPDVEGGTVWFQYGTSPAYGSSTGPQSLPAGTSGSAYGASLTGLTPGTAYHFRVVAEDPDGTTYGPDQVFTTASTSTSTSPSTPPPHHQAPPPSNRFSFGTAKVAGKGTISLAVVVPDTGRLVAKASFTVRRTVIARVHGKRVVRHVVVTYVYGTASGTSARGGTVILVLHLSRVAGAELKKLGRARVAIAVKFVPSGGQASQETKTVAVARSWKGRYS